MEARGRTVCDVLGSTDRDLSGTDRLRTDDLCLVHTLLELNTGVFIRLVNLVCLTLLHADFVALACFDLAVQLAQSLSGLVCTRGDVLRRVRKGEAREGRKVVEDAATFLGEILADDGDEGAECAREVASVALGLVAVNVHVGGCGG